MPTLTAAELVSRAFRLAGLKAIVSLDEDAERARWAKDVWPGHREYLIGLHHWTFTRRHRQLAQLAQAPIAEWQYAYTLPSDLFNGPKQVWNSNSPTARPITGWELFGDRQLVTNETEIWIEYQILPDESLWPPYFAKLAVVSFAADAALAIAESDSRSAELEARAWGPPSRSRTGGIFAQAKRQDKSREPMRTLSDSTLLDAHRGARF